MVLVLNKLTAVAVKKKKKPGRYGDGGGLWLQVSPTGTKSWAFIYSINRKRNRQLGLGTLEDVSLAAARDKADAHRLDLKNGIDPIDAKRLKEVEKRIAVQKDVEADNQLKAAKLAEVTFKQAATEYITENRHHWKNRKHADQWEATLSQYAYPIIGDMPVGLIETAHVRKVIKPCGR